MIVPRIRVQKRFTNWKRFEYCYLQILFP